MRPRKGGRCKGSGPSFPQLAKQLLVPTDGVRGGFSIAFHTKADRVVAPVHAQPEQLAVEELSRQKRAGKLQKGLPLMGQDDGPTLQAIDLKQECVH